MGIHPTTKMDPETAELFRAFFRFREWKLGRSVDIVDESMRANYRRTAILQAQRASDLAAEIVKGKVNEDELKKITEAVAGVTLRRAGLINEPLRARVEEKLEAARCHTRVEEKLGAARSHTRVGEKLGAARSRTHVEEKLGSERSQSRVEEKHAASSPPSRVEEKLDAARAQPCPVSSLSGMSPSARRDFFARRLTENNGEKLKKEEVKVEKPIKKEMEAEEAAPRQLSDWNFVAPVAQM